MLPFGWHDSQENVPLEDARAVLNAMRPRFTAARGRVGAHRERGREHLGCRGVGDVDDRERRVDGVQHVGRLARRRARRRRGRHPAGIAPRRTRAEHLAVGVEGRERRRSRAGPPACPACRARRRRSRRRSRRASRRRRSRRCRTASARRRRGARRRRRGRRGRALPQAPPAQSRSVTRFSNMRFSSAARPSRWLRASVFETRRGGRRPSRRRRAACRRLRRSARGASVFASYTKRSRSGRSRSRITRPPMFGPVAKSKIVPRSSRSGSRRSKIVIGNSQPSSKSLLSSRPRGSSGAQLGNSVWLPDSKAATKSLLADDRQRARRLGADLDAVCGLISARPPLEADHEHLVGLVERDEGAASAGEDDADGLVGRGDALGVEALERLHHLERLRLTTLMLSERWLATRTSSSPLRLGRAGAPRRSPDRGRPGSRRSSVSSAGSLGSMREHRERARRGVGDVEDVALGGEGDGIRLRAREERAARGRGPIARAAAAPRRRRSRAPSAAAAEERAGPGRRAGVRRRWRASGGAPGGVMAVSRAPAQARASGPALNSG